MSDQAVGRLVRAVLDEASQIRSVQLMLRGLKGYDEYTYWHSLNVAVLSIALGSRVATDNDFLSPLAVGALLHDLGKINIDLRILNKPGQLNPDEWAQILTHPWQGAEIVAVLPDIDPSVVVIVLEHHVRYDASGYPQQVPPRQPRLSSRIVAIAETYDAITAGTSYSARRGHDEAMRELTESAGSQLDPTLVRMFGELMGA